MDEDGFRKACARMGKRPHVIDGLVCQVQRFEDFLRQERQKDLVSAEPQDFQDFLASLDEKTAGKQVRGLALYYRFLGNAGLTGQIVDFRDKQVAKGRRAFPLAEFRGVDLGIIEKLRACGIVHVDQMLAAGATPESRRRLAEAAQVPEPAVLELVKLSDLSRLGGMKAVRARLYYEAGADTPEAIARWEPEALRAMLVQFVQDTGFEGIPPLPKEVRNGVTHARSLPKIVEY